jgi:cytochrome c oxidase assembly factor CtaG
MEASIISIIGLLFQVCLLIFLIYTVSTMRRNEREHKPINKYFLWSIGLSAIIVAIGLIILNHNEIQIYFR